MMKKLQKIASLVLLVSSSLVFSKDPDIYTFNNREYIIRDHQLQPKDPKPFDSHTVSLRWDAEKNEMVIGKSLQDGLALGGLLGMPILCGVAGHLAKNGNVIGAAAAGIAAAGSGICGLAGARDKSTEGQIFMGGGSLFVALVAVLVGYGANL